ncbi:MAG: response regulator [Acidobacteria bacterium]|nr:response regulator [Acidobacteriota bacterium]
MQAVAPPLAGEVSVKPASVLVVDDNEGVRYLFNRLLTQEGYLVDVADDGVSALAKVEHAAPDVVLLDVTMPGLDGFEVCRRLKRESATRLIPVILITALNAAEQRVEGRRTGADDYINKPVDPDELLARVGAAVRLKRYTDDLDSAASIIMMLAEMIERRDGYVEGHCHRMANYACTLGRRLGLGADDLQALHRGGFLHDIGMLAIPEAIVCKSQPLEPEEFELVKSHTVQGDQLLANLRSLQPVRPIVRHHHERFDGSGYPDGLRGDAIPLLAQVMSIADVFDAVTTKRSYQDANSVAKAIEALRHEADRGWRRRDLVEEFIAAVAGTLAM